MRHPSIDAKRTALACSIEPGVSAALDEAAAAADPRHAFLRRAWYEAAGGADVRTLVARRSDGHAVAALPTALAGPAWLKLRTVPGSYWPFRSAPLAADLSDAELVSLLANRKAHLALGRAWRMGPVNRDDPTAARLRTLAPLAGWSLLERRVATAYLLDLEAARREGPWPRASTLKKNRSHEKRLASQGVLEWRFVSGDGWTATLFDDLERIERRAWVGQKSGANAKFADPAQREFWEQAVADPMLAQMLTSGLLYIGGEPAAFSFGLEAGQVRYCIATSYDERFAKHSPGKVLSYRTLADAADRGVTLLDHGAGDGGHKSTMGSSPGPEIVDLLFVRGRIAAALLRRFWNRSSPRIATQDENAAAS